MIAAEGGEATVFAADVTRSDDAALFLVSDEACYITGVVLPVDGGVTIASPAR